MRAVYEGLAFAARDCYLATGAAPREVRLGGGAARSTAIRSILASTLGASVCAVKREETGAAGAAMIGAVCLGVYADMARCAEAWVTPLLGEASEPDPALVDLYARLFAVYVDIRARMPPAWAALAEARQAPMTAEIAIIGDRFMTPPTFEAALRRKCGEDLAVRVARAALARRADAARLRGTGFGGAEGISGQRGRDRGFRRRGRDLRHATCAGSRPACWIGCPI